MSSLKDHLLPSVAAAGSVSSGVSTDAAMQEGTTSLSMISLVIDSLKKEVEAERCVYIKKKMEENRMKLAGITNNNHRFSVARRNLGIINGGKTDNFLTKRQKDAIDMRNGDAISSSQDDGRASVILLGCGIPVENYVPPINLPKVEKIPPYTTWIFLDRNQKMTEDQTVVGRRRIYYDRNGGEALICSDSEEDETVDEEDEKKEFAESEDNIIGSTIEQTGPSDIVYDLLAQRLFRKPCEIKERYEALKCSKPGDADFNMNSFLDKDLETAQDSFNKLFCRRCLIFDCKLHGCSQELIFPAENGCSAWKSMDDESVPCGPHCYLQLETNAGEFLRKRLKTSSNAHKDYERIDSKTIPVHDVNPTNRSPSPNKKKRMRKSVKGGGEETKEFTSSSTKAKLLSKLQSRRKDSFVPTGNQLIPGSNNTKKKNVLAYDQTFGKITDFESWRTLEKCLFKKGLKIFGQNSCLIARNVMGGRKTCAEVYHVLHYHENKLYSQGSNSIDSQNGVDMTKSNENMGTARRRRSNFFHRRSRYRRLKYTWKSAGSHSLRKRISDIKDLHCRQYNPCGCHSVCGGDCSCLANGTCCEKYCGCPKTCKIRFRGCHCAKSQCRSRQCPCFAANRECDPDVCRHCWISCGDGTLGSPGTKGNSYECQNMKLLLKQQQRVLLGRSEVSGWGAFLKNSVAKDEYLGEYTGELISHHEADKRGKIYDLENSSFLFNLNDQYVLDAYRKGDKLKFANHSPDPNCYAKVMMVAGDHRVGIFAKENISAGEELFYDYRYEPDKAPSWAKKPGDCSSRKEDAAASSSSGRAKKLA